MLRREMEKLGRLDTPLFKCNLDAVGTTDAAGATHNAAERTLSDQWPLLDRCIELAIRFKTPYMRVFAFWRKGDTSGDRQLVRRAAYDCDGDTLLALVDQTGVACHTGRHNCFFRALRNGKLETIAPVIVSGCAPGADLRYFLGVRHQIPWTSASATATVHTVSSVKRAFRWNSGVKSLPLKWLNS